MNRESIEQQMLANQRQREQRASEEYNNLLHKPTGKPVLLPRNDNGSNPYHERVRKRIIMESADGSTNDILESISAYSRKYDVEYTKVRQSLLFREWLFVPSLKMDVRFKYEE